MVFCLNRSPIHVLNLICAMIFMYSLSKIFFKTIIHLVYISYNTLLDTVLAMGFTRQGVAFSFVLLAITSLLDERKFRFFYLYFLGTLFHKSCLIMLCLAIISNKNLFNFMNNFYNYFCRIVCFLYFSRMILNI